MTSISLTSKISQSCALSSEMGQYTTITSPSYFGRALFGVSLFGYTIRYGSYLLNSQMSNSVQLTSRLPI